MRCGVTVVRAPLGAGCLGWAGRGPYPLQERVEEKPERVRLSILWPERVKETLTLTSVRLVVEDEAIGPAEEMAVLIPFLTDASANPARCRVLSPGASPPARLNVKEPNRYGFLDAYRATVKGNRIAYEIEP